MAKSPIEQMTAELPVTLKQTASLIDDPPAHFSDKQKRRASEFHRKYAGKIRSVQAQRYTTVMDDLTQRRDAIKAQVAETRKRAESLSAAVQHGRLPGGEAREQVAEIIREHTQLLDQLEAIEQAVEEAWQMVSTDPADFQEQALRRFPATVDALPRLSEDYLNGDNLADPFRSE